MTPDGGLFWGGGGHDQCICKNTSEIWILELAKRYDAARAPCLASFWHKRVTNTIQLQSKQEWLRFVHFSIAYNYHVSSVCFRNFLQAFMSIWGSCTCPRSKGWKNPEKNTFNVLKLAETFMGQGQKVLWKLLLCKLPLTWDEKNTIFVWGKSKSMKSSIVPDYFRPCRLRAPPLLSLSMVDLCIF